MSSFLQDWLTHLQGIDKLPTSPTEIDVGPPQLVQGQMGNQMAIPGLNFQEFTTQPITAQIPADSVHHWLKGAPNAKPEPR